MRARRRKIKSLSKLKIILRDLREGGRKIVFTNGCFDILHAGHLKYLEAAKRYGDILVVAINSDKSVRKIKGDSRPIVGEKDRAYVLSALESVGFVTIFNETTPLNTIMALKPDVIVKGADWRKEDIIGGKFVESYGGKVVRLAYLKGYSTTDIIKRCKVYG